LQPSFSGCSTNLVSVHAADSTAATSAGSEPLHTSGGHMKDRYNDRSRQHPYRTEPGYRRDERGFVDRAEDEVRSWFGDDAAEARRRMDERERERDRDWDDRDRDRPRGSAPYRTGSERAWTDNDREASRPGGYGSEYIPPVSGARGFDDWPGYRRWSGYRGEGEQDASWTSSGRYAYGDPADPSRRRGGNGFTGRGPKGYQRSDARITEDVCDRLSDDPEIDASDVEVRVENGEVTLSGTVPDRRAKRRAEDLVEDVSGVREVHNHMRIAQAPPAAPADGVGQIPGSIRR
jgi:osmotically-inducible protein OsmY